MRELTGFQRDLLVVIAGLETPSGLDLKRELERSQDLSVLSSRIYNNLDELVSEGLIEKGINDGRTNSYSVTTAGVDAVRERYRWRESYLPVDEVLRAEHEPASPRRAAVGVGTEHMND